jgi:ABC-2 type transport system ATP-binding protein
MAFIQVDDISKNYQVYKRERGLLNNIKSLFHREYTVKEAVKHVSFSIERGETVGYIGMNGAGKSTTIKMLSGILTPSSGTITVGGLIPYERRKENARQMGAVFGQRSRLNWDLPMADTFELYRKMYDIDHDSFRHNVRVYTELLEMDEFINRPIRQLSLGEKMRANLALAFLHNPTVVYLDEPTIGLDVVAKSRIRGFIREINQNSKVTVMLTTHDMTDIEKICERLIFIHHGEIFYDGSLAEFKNTFGSGYNITVISADILETDLAGLTLISHEDNKYVFSGDKRSLSVEQALAAITGQGKIITSIQVDESSIESIVMKIVDNAKQ